MYHLPSAPSTMPDTQLGYNKHLFERVIEPCSESTLTEIFQIKEELKYNGNNNQASSFSLKITREIGLLTYIRSKFHMAILD